jgi:cell wall-associated NlpC family hydrolase
VRGGPSTAYSIIHVLRQGETVKIIGESNGWFQIQLPDGRVGWSSGQYLRLSNQAKVTASQLNVRSGPSTAYSIIHVLRQGEAVEIISESNGWYQIRLADGRVGWSSGQYLSLNNQASARQAKVDAVINRAKSFLGTPYVWGGASPSDGGFDCSGFTQYVFAQSGYTLNRVSKDQALNGTYVPRGSTEPGDLVFYSHAQNGVIDHVGIYLGDGRMIHSPKTGDVVRIADVTTDYWTSRYVTTRRIIP